MRCAIVTGVQTCALPISETGVQGPLVRQKDRAFDLEPIGCEPLEADRRIGAIGIGPEILPYARLRVEIGSDRAAVEELDLGALDAFAVNPFAYAIEREPIAISAVQLLAVPAAPLTSLRSNDRLGGETGCC